MDILQTHEWLRAAIAVAGALGVYLGYRLFCDISYQRTRSMWLTSLASGALLAVFGLGILFAAARDMRSSSFYGHPALRKNPTREGSFQAPGADQRRNVPVRLV